MHSNNVLLVEDDELVAASITSVMRSRGYAVTSFRSAEELIAHSESEPSGCMIIDIEFGAAKMSGIELLRWMRSNQWTIPVIVLSGKVTVSEAVEALKASVVDIISKPPSVPRLISAVEISFAGLKSSAPKDATLLANRLQSLTTTERSVLTLLLAGSPNKLIASRLELGLRSAVRYRKSILDRFGFGTVPELASALGAAGIRLTELPPPSACVPGIPQQQRAEIRDRIRQLQSSLAKADPEAIESLRGAVSDAQAALDRLLNHSHLAALDVGDSVPSIVVLAEDSQLGGLLRDLLRSHGLFAESCTSTATASVSHEVHPTVPPNYLVAFESKAITVEQLQSLRVLYGDTTQLILISTEQNAGNQPENIDILRLASPINGQSLVQKILSKIPPAIS